MSIRQLFASVILLGMLHAPHAADAAEITVATARGEVTLPEKPEKVVVFDLAALDTLDALGVSVHGVPGSNIPPSLEKYMAADYTKVGSLFEPDYEAVNALEPDLIIVGARSAAKFEDLARLATTIDMSTDPKDYAGSIRRNALTLGRIFGKEDIAKALVGKLEASIAALREKAKGKGRALVLLTTGGKISAYGPGSRFGQLHDQYGMAAADPSLDVATHGQAVSFEYILKTNPDWLFVVDRDAAIGNNSGQPAARLLDNELVAKTNAWKNGRVVYLDPVKMYLTASGIRAEQGVVDEISAALGE